MIKGVRATWDKVAGQDEPFTAIVDFEEPMPDEDGLVAVWFAAHKIGTMDTEDGLNYPAKVELIRD
jgi:hypothetical protein